MFCLLIILFDFFSYNLRLLSVDDTAGGMKQSLQQLLAENPDISAVFLGGRLQDPGHGNLQPMQYTDKGPLFGRSTLVEQIPYSDLLFRHMRNFHW